MANVSVGLNLGKSSFTKNKNYNQIFENTQEVDNTDGFINLLSVSKTKAIATVPSIKAFCVYNMGSVAAEIQFVYQEWKNNSNVDDANAVDTGGGSTNLRYITMFLPAGDFFYLPHGRLIGYNADASAANATTITNTAPDSNMYTTTGGTVVLNELNYTTDNLVIEISHGHEYYKVGDLIRVENEIMEVLGTYDDNPTALTIADNHIAVKRGLHGSTNVEHSGTPTVNLPFFNLSADFDKFSTAQTDKSGFFHAKNFFGYGRRADGISDGIQAGSIAIKFYQTGYQELGLSNITSSTNSGLAASTEYKFNITVDGGSTFSNLTFTTDSSNTNFGGKNGILFKIQDALNTQYYTSGNLFEKRVSVGIVGGDKIYIRTTFINLSYCLSCPSGGGTTPFGVGRIPAIGSIEGAVAAKLPDDTVYDKATYDSAPNTAAFMYDNGDGSLSGAGSGSINYETGEIQFSAVPNASFVISAVYASAHSGGVNADTTNGKNTIQTIGARSVNPKLNTNVKVIAYN